MAYKIRIDNNKVYDLKDGFIIKEEYNETLDSATVVFSTYGESIGAQSFDLAEIYDDANKISKKSMLVDSGDEEIYSFNENDNNDHINTLMLFSQTKELERITLPNLSITQPITEGSTKKSVWTVIERYCLMYLPKVRVYRSSGRFELVSKYEIDYAVRTKFQNIECPEFQWNKPTLREVLTDLFSTADCIPIIRNNKLTYYSLTELGEPIDTSKLNYSKRSFGSADYIGELTIDMHNAIGTSKTRVCEKKSLRVSGGMWNTNDACFITQHPIYNVVSCKVSYYFMHNPDMVTLYTEYHKEIDITRFIVEKDIYDVSSTERYEGDDIDEALTHKQYLLYYERGSNKIEAWGFPTKIGITSHVLPSIEWILVLLGEAQKNGGFASNEVNEEGGTFIGLHVDLVYETLTQQAMHVGKYLPSKHPDNRVFDNQSSSYVDANHQSIFEYAKANRLGNKIREIHGIYFNESDIPQLGDYIGDEILFSREVHYDDEQFTFIGYLTKNYILKDYFTGVQAKRRSWQLAKGDEALTRNEIIKRYIEFSFDYKEEENSFYSSMNTNMFVDAFASYDSNSSIKYCTIRSTQTKPMEGGGSYIYEYPSGSHRYQLDLDKSVQGMSLCFNFGTMDNVAVDSYFQYDSDDNAYYSNLYKYCDENGEFRYLQIYLNSYIDAGDNQIEFDSDGTIYNSDSSSSGTQKMKSVLKIVMAKPKINNLACTDEFNRAFTLYKDNRETIRVSMQFEYCSDTKDIVVTQEFIKLCSAFNNLQSVEKTLKVYVSENETYLMSDTTPKGNYDSNRRAVLAIGAQHKLRLKLQGGTALNNIKSWCVATSDGKLLLGVNTNSTDTEVYANFLENRDCNIYKSLYDYRIVGTISDSQEELDEKYAELNARPLTTANRLLRRRAINSVITLQPDELSDIETENATIVEAYPEIEDSEEVKKES